MFDLAWLASVPNAIRYTDLGLDPVALDLGILQIRWYSLAYLTGLIFGYWYINKLIRVPGAPMAKRHSDDLLFWATIGIILGGRIGYVVAYQPEILQNPLDILKLWEGGMSFHGGLTGLILAIIFYCRRHGLSALRVADYIACVAPVGQFLGRIANFINGELWGRSTDVAWGMIFPGGGEVVRHPSQLYAAALEGLLVFAVVNLLFWKTRARYQPGLLLGAAIFTYACARFTVGFFREPDAQLMEFAERTGLAMGQWLTLPMFLIGLYLILTARKRRQRVEPIAGSDAVA